MPTSAPAPPRFSPVADTLTAGRLGVPQVVFFVMSAATPLTVTAGVITTAYAATGLLGLPVAFVAIGLLLGLFSVGYVAMARHVGNCGAFYSYLARGLGKPAGVAGAWVALLAYNTLQVGLYGAIGSAACPLIKDWFDVDVSWWVVALSAWALTAILGLLRVDVNGMLLSVLLLAEIAVIVVYSVSDLANPAGGSIDFSALSPSGLFEPGVGALFCLAILGSIGFESAVVFSEESKDPRKTVPMATYLSVGIIAVLYTLSSWAMTVAVGPDQIAETAGKESVGLIFGLADAQLGSAASTIGQTLFVTSVIAAMIAFHNTTSRYMYALGREGVLPRPWGKTSPSTGSPHIASLTQSAIAVIVIAVYMVLGTDPMITLFYYGGTGGAMGVLFLIAATSVAVVAFFIRDSYGESLWRRRIAPIMSMFLLWGVAFLVLMNADVLLGVPPDHVLVWAIPTAIGITALLGLLWGLILRNIQPDVYARIGMGAKAALPITSPVTVVPNPRHDTSARTHAPMISDHSGPEVWR